jgi:AraC-like DNA-binding protein
MKFERVLPRAELTTLVDSYWVVQHDSLEVVTQKIIPDGFLEIIFHFGDPYRINLSGQWNAQSPCLLAGQLSKHFFLENTGRTDMLGIKFRPPALTHLFALSMHNFTDRVVNLHEALPGTWQDLEQKLSEANAPDRIALVESHLLKISSPPPDRDHPIERAINEIFLRKGLITVEEITVLLNLSERTVQQLFKKYVGLSPKLYSRIIRFATVFEVMKTQPPAWMDVVVQAGYYDQSHFIRNFKDFTGEDPGSYGFEGHTLANFFMRKP